MCFERREAGLHGLITDQLRLVTLVSYLALLFPSMYVGAMFHCRRNASGAALLLQRLEVTLLDASRSLRNYRCSRVYRRLTASKAVLFRSRLHESPPDLVAHARMAAFSLNSAAPYSDARNGDRNVLKLNELESFLSVRSSAPVAIQTRRSSTTPEKTRDERAANIQTVRQLFWSSDETVVY